MHSHDLVYVSNMYYDGNLEFQGINQFYVRILTSKLHMFAIFETRIKNLAI